jgi:hypothetical protein
MSRRTKAIFLSAAALLAVGCGDDQLMAPEYPGTEGGVSSWLRGDALPQDQLDFVLLSPTAPPLETMDTTFWAVRGKERELQIRFQGASGSRGDDDDEASKLFLELEIEEKTLLRWPDGTPFAEDDSVQIRVTIDPGTFFATFEPAGLEFDPQHKAELAIHYDEAAAEYFARVSEFDIWRQEQPGDAWVAIGSANVQQYNKIKGRLQGFTRYALAVGR